MDLSAFSRKIAEKLHFIIRKTANIRYNRKEVNRKLNQILLQVSPDLNLERNRL